MIAACLCPWQVGGMACLICEDLRYWSWYVGDKTEESTEREKKEGDELCVCGLENFTRPCLFVSLQLVNEGPLMEERVQALLCVVVAQVLKGRATFTLHQPGVLKAWSVHNEQRAQGVLSRFQRSGAHGANTYMYTQTLALLEATSDGLYPLHLTLKFNLGYLQSFPNFNPQSRGDPANPSAVVQT